MSRRPTSQSAFTLIEVMLASTVLLVGITSMIYAVGMGAEILDTARKSQIAQQIIDGEINRMRVADWGTGPIPSGIPGTTSYPRNPDSATIIIDQNGTANGLTGDDAHKWFFGLTNFTSTSADDNRALLNLAKGFTVTLKVITPVYTQETAPPSAPFATKADDRIFSYTVQWNSTLGKLHTRNGVAYIGRYGLAASHKR